MGEGIRKGRGGRQVEPRRKAGTAGVEAYEALPRRTGTAGNGEETGQRRGRNGWGRKAGAAEVEAYEALPRRTGTAGNGQGTIGDGGKTG